MFITNAIYFRTFAVPMQAPGRSFQIFDPIDPMALVGFIAIRLRGLLIVRHNLQEYYAPPPIYTSQPPQFSGYYPTADGRFAADAYGPFVPTPQHSDNPIDFGRIFYEPIAAPQPPVPPAAPAESIPPNSLFHYHQCQWLGGPRCDGLAPGKNREMGEHLRVYHHFIGHERDTVQCEWQNCGQTMQRMNVPRHIVSRHLLAAARCRFCGRRFSRPDVVARHERTCAGVLPVSSSAAVRI
ncbi:hypothetical protein J3R83DRAFT_4278 [Lanmaoa asiatica]|nr:hypothetical protein J3R83DRAFT_4278 [Lanmaoa asiatica]